MTYDYTRTGELKALGSYPLWVQELIDRCAPAKQAVVDHEMWQHMRHATLDPESAENFLVSVWPFIERFPSYMAGSLMKTQYGRSHGDNMARHWLLKNMKIEQKHAEFWIDWAVGSGIPENRVLHPARIVHGTELLPNWCEEVSGSQYSLAAGMIATNYAIEGVTGEWASLVYESETYRQSLPEKTRASTLRWLKLHAAYDDAHPWEALEIVATIIGTHPQADVVDHLIECVIRSYTAMKRVGDLCLTQRQPLVWSRDAVAIGAR